MQSILNATKPFRNQALWGICSTIFRGLLLCILLHCYYIRVALVILKC